MRKDYEKDVFRHLQETIEKVDRLTDKIVTMEKEHARETEILKTKIVHLEKENQALRTGNQKLKDIIDKNSGNSSKPPSSDGFVKIQNNREVTGKKPGGQPGHKGKVHRLFDDPTKIEDIKTKKCQCGGLVKYYGKYTAKQLVEIEFTTSITEYREHEGI